MLLDYSLQMSRDKKHKKEKKDRKKKKEKRHRTEEEIRRKKEKSSHKKEKINLWPEEKMKQMLDMWNRTAEEDRLSYRQMGIKFGIPYNTAR